jgi:four helix bundle protein
MAKGDDIQERLINFAVEIIKLSNTLPKNQAGCHIANQIMRSGTSGAPNYAEARGAESRKDFIHKMGIALKELNETEIWLEMIKRSGLVPEIKTIGVAQECSELARIINASIRTAQKQNA